MTKLFFLFFAQAAAVFLCAVCPAGTPSEQFKANIYQPGKLAPTETSSALKPGDKAPDFNLPSIADGPVSLGSFAGRKIVVISFVPAAWTPVCSNQWPGYNIVKDLFDQKDAVLLGITVDNIPTLYAWTNEMGGVWFPVLSDFWPHGETAKKYGVLRPEGVSERALFIIDKKGIIRYVDVHDINEGPKLEVLVNELEKAGQDPEKAE